MAKHGKAVGLAFLVIITALFSALVMPQFFNNLINQQTADNRQMYRSIRLLLIISVIFLIGLPIAGLVRGNKDV